ncbi:MAG: hypothetical protein A3J27_08640 [Candidatus Tectomicrobia bacterium RIFCSPLOWO2_12_FULL_69_37]|nr:MAG: hypothetical protein A3J27_08640 [Candidatus Tectomicrobia bacterium RIFCSPLOWO2_12_FULL_69_37]
MKMAPVPREASAKADCATARTLSSGSPTRRARARITARRLTGRSCITMRRISPWKFTRKSKSAASHSAHSRKDVSTRPAAWAAR